MRSLVRWMAYCVWVVLASSAAANPVTRDHIEVELVSELSSIAPGMKSRLGIRFLPEDQWHTYWTNPGDSGLPIELAWSLPDQAEIGQIEWPYPQRIEVGHLVNYGYEGEHLLPVEVQWPDDLIIGEPIDVQVHAEWLVCKVECIPGEATLSLSLPITASVGEVEDTWTSLFRWADQRRPVWVDDEAVFKIESNQISIQLSKAAAWGQEAPSAEHIFITSANVVDHAKPFFIAEGGDVLQLVLPQSPYFAGRLDRLGVVLVDPQTGHAFQWEARAGDLVSASNEPLSLAYGWVMLMALIGGVLLNLMPCVFPVLSIKALHLVQTPAGQHRSHALAYTAGVMASFAALAMLLLALRAGGQAVGWGFQLQSPWVVGVLIYVFFVMGLSLSGLVMFGAGLMGVGQTMTQSSTHRGSFMTGVLATAVASPCTAPLMGTALGVAVLLPWAMGLGVFLMLGLGLALPMLLLGLVPSLARHLPRPGPWMDTFKQAMAFPLYLAVVWLVWVLGRQTDAMAVGYILVGLVALAFVLWLAGLPERHPKFSGVRHSLVALGVLFSLVMLASASRTPNTFEPTASLSEPFSMERLQAAIDDPSSAVFVNMTADWCVTCLVNEQVALSGPMFEAALESNNILYLKGDWTRRDEVITEYLAQFGRNGVPLYVVYPKDGSTPRVLPQILTPNAVIDTLNAL